MAIEQLPGDHLHLVCDLPGCTFEGPTLHAASEGELLDMAEARGWSIERELGLHYCPLTTVRDCEVCGAPTRSARGGPGGRLTYYCAAHWSR
jgi:hypothetical protein